MKGIGHDRPEEPAEPPQTIEQFGRTYRLDDGWQPIETAQRSIGPILIGWHDAKSGGWQTRAAWFEPEFLVEYTDDCDEPSYIGAWTDGAVASWGDEATCAYQPTHWMPLPAPPAIKEPTP